MSDKKNYHMSPAEFRRYGKKVIDWIADYYEQVEDYPVLSQVKPGDIQASLPDAAPETGEDFMRILTDMDDKILPGITHWQSPNFYGFFPCNASGPAILGDLLSSGLGVQGMMWATSPACTEVETRVLDWLVQPLALPEKFKSTAQGGGVIQDSASSSTLCSLLAARERATSCETNANGCDRSLTAYCSTQTHSSIEKAMGVVGMGRNMLRQIEVDKNFAMRADKLAEQIARDKAAGLQPVYVCATLGTTSSTATDPIQAIGKICAREDLWLHIDSAMVGTAALCPEYHYLHEGVEHAMSYCFNPHKWMFTNFDCSCFWVADRNALISALSIMPEYLKNQASESDTVFDYRDWQVPLGRRFRALKLWFVLRYYGLEGLRFHIRRHIELCQQLVGWIEADNDYELMAPAPFNLICFRHKGGDTFNRRLMDTLNASGEMYFTHTILNGKFVLRLCIGQTQTEQRHVQQAWELIQATAASIKKTARF
ncbi:MAG: pyridoxal-dependent decarboxylase [Gammaproteobacteria bacterium]